MRVSLWAGVLKYRWWQGLAKLQELWLVRPNL